MREEKDRIRKEIRSRQKELTYDYKKEASHRIAGKVIASEEFKKAETVFIYISMPTEPDTREILQAAWDGKKRVCVPKCLDHHQMKAVLLSSMEELIPGAMNIPEPADDSKSVSANEIDLAIVPCVSASVDGRRLGHGAGFYDIFMSGQRMKKICICFDALLRDDIPVDELDIPMDMVIS